MKRFHVSKNLCDEDYTGISNTITYKPLYVGNGDYTLSSSIPNGEGGVKNLFLLAGNASSGASSASNGVALNISRTVTAIDGYVTIAFRLRADGAPYSPANYDTMLNTGSTALPYEPYGDTWQTKSPPRYGTATDAVTTLPVMLYTDGQPVSSYTLKGNTSTSGTPSPSNPITIEGVGNKTANLFDEVYPSISSTAVYKPVYVGSGEFTLSSTIQKENDVALLFFLAGNVSTGIGTNTNGVWEGQNRTVTAVDGYVTIAYRKYNTAPENSNTMLNVGSAALPYEPYGYKISISSNSTALTPVYLTEQLMKINDYADSLASSGTVSRSIKQVAFTGQEEWEHYGSSVFWTRVENNGVLVNGNGLSNSYIYNPTTSNVPTTIENGECGLTSSNGRVYIKNTNYANATAFKQYLADQNATGTPVTMYYVINTATTESVTAPSILTTGGEVSIDVDTAVKPSELDLTYHGWHSHEPLKRENGSWS